MMNPISKNYRLIRDEANKVKENCVPKNVLTLEKLFDLQSKFRRPANPKTNSSTMMHFLVNLGTSEQPKYVNLGTCCSEAEKHTFTELFKRYRDVFSWTYDDMKTYDTQIIQHVIPIKEGVKPFQQNLRKIHPTLKPLIQKELKKLLDAQIIFKVHIQLGYLTWCPLGRSSGEIRICIDFHEPESSFRQRQLSCPPYGAYLATHLWL
jgi:hypothetical protein